MDTKQYITSGILELYVLDRLEPAEMRAVEAMAAEHPEIKAELDQIELALESFVMSVAPEVNPDILRQAMEEIRSTPEPKPTGSRIPKAPPKKAPSGMMTSVLPWLLALAGLLGLLYFYNQSGQQGNELEALQARYDKLEKDCEENQHIIQSTQKLVNELTAPGTHNVILAGSVNTPNKSAIVFYNPTMHKTLFKATNLPPPPSGKQYQLWAIDADGPKDLGVLAFHLKEDTILEVDHLSEVIAFAITLEDEGGKPTPDLNHLQVIGNVGQG